MTPAMSHPLATAFLSTVPWLMAQALPASEGPRQRSLIVSLPHGGCTLMIHADGSGVIQYGAAPRSVRVAAGSFDVDRIIETVSPTLLPWSSRTTLDAEPASVTLPGSNQVHLGTDTDAIRRLLEQAWRVRLLPDALRFKEEQWDQEWLERACGF